MKIAKVFALLIIALGFLGLYFLKDVGPVLRLLASSIGMIGVIKVAALLWQISDGLTFRSLHIYI